jgi:hypothetical protein
MSNIPICVICGAPCLPIGSRIAHNRRYCGVGNRCRNAAFKSKQQASAGVAPTAVEPPVPIETLSVIDDMVLGTLDSAVVSGPLPKLIPDFVEATPVGPNQWKLTTK